MWIAFFLGYKMPNLGQPQNRDARFLPLLLPKEKRTYLTFIRSADKTAISEWKSYFLNSNEMQAIYERLECNIEEQLMARKNSYSFF